MVLPSNLVLKLNMLGKYFSRQPIEIVFLFFPEKQVLTFHANRLKKYQSLFALETDCMRCQNRKEGNDQESIQLSHTSYQRHQRERNTNTN